MTRSETRPRRRLAIALATSAGVANVIALTPAAKVWGAGTAAHSTHRSAEAGSGSGSGTEEGRLETRVEAPDGLVEMAVETADLRAVDEADAVTIASVSAAAPVTEASAASGSSTETDYGEFTVTCYDLRGRTASGAEAGPDSVAVDPSVIPLGRQIYIQGVGYRTADDTGGDIQGHHVDIWEPSYSDCQDWGVQDRDVRMVG